VSAEQAPAPEAAARGGRGQAPVRACLLPASGSGAGLEVGGLAVGERTRRGIEAAGIPWAEAAGPQAGITLFVAGDAVVEPGAAERLLDAVAPGQGAVPEGAPQPAPAALALALEDAPTAAEWPRTADDLGALAARLRAQGRLRDVAMADAIAERVSDRAAARRLDRRIMAALVQPGDGFFARHFDRKLSRPLSRLLVRRGVRPNPVTLMATAVGLLGAAGLAAPWQWLQVSGALLFVVSTVLDGCDGEVARLSFTRSEFGRRLDLVCDNVVNAAVFLAIGWGALRSGALGSPALLVGITLVGFGLATVAGWSFGRWLDRTGRGEEYRSLYESLASRDFAYFVLMLALIDRLHVFVWFAAFGSFGFVALVLVIWLRSGRPEEGQWA